MAIIEDKEILLKTIKEGLNVYNDSNYLWEQLID